MKPTVLVVTTVHWPDDTRIRERLIRSLDRDFAVDYATKKPGPSDKSGLQWLPLAGGRFRRLVGAMALALRRHWSILVIHDPELIPVGLAARWLRRRPVVLDVHENIPATALTRSWVPRAVRSPLSRLLAHLLRFAEKHLVVTLAESNYQSLFSRSHPVFPNYPDTADYPEPVSGRRSAVYLGDVTEERGLLVAAEACRQADIDLVVVGRVAPAFAAKLREATDGARLELVGPLPNREALTTIAGGGVALSPLLDNPNYRQSAPTKILEYLALGLPVVASDLPGTRRLVEGLHGVALVPPGDVPALAAEIKETLDSDKRKKSAEQAADVRARFTWPARAVREFYASLA